MPSAKRAADRSLGATAFYQAASLYGLALAIYLGSRFVRRSQGIDMKMVHSEIPAE